MANLFLAILVSTYFSLVGCQTSVSVMVWEDELVKPNTPANMQLNFLSKAQDVRTQAVDQVGRHTISLLMIPGPTVTTEREHLDDAIAKRVKSALQLCGYTINEVDKIKESKGPVLVVQIDDLRNYLFSWIYPLGLVWGKMELSLHLMSPEGKELWRANAEGHGGIMASLLYMSGFETRVTSDLTANVNQIIEIVSSEQFKNELRKAQSGS